LAPRSLVGETIGEFPIIVLDLRLLDGDARDRLGLALRVGQLPRPGRILNADQELRPFPVVLSATVRAAVGFPKMISAFANAVVSLSGVLQWIVGHAATP
jgi:hypothetical protein